MAKLLIVANWKMNPDSPGRAIVLAQKIERGILRGNKNVEVIIAPPYPFLIPIGKVLKNAKLGAQNAFYADVGPYTGEVSWHHLKHLKVSHVIIGHSERRINLGETDELINRKLKAVLQNGMSAILCVGEQKREGNEIPSLVGEQIKMALYNVTRSQLKNLVIAYEPVWAVSTTPGSRPDTPDNAFKAMLYIRKVISGLYGRAPAQSVKIIYGGSVRANNAKSFLEEG